MDEINKKACSRDSFGGRNLTKHLFCVGLQSGFDRGRIKRGPLYLNSKRIIIS